MSEQESSLVYLFINYLRKNDKLLVKLRRDSLVKDRHSLLQEIDSKNEIPF